MIIQSVMSQLQKFSVAVEYNKTANSEKITILEYKYGVKGDRGLSNSNIIAPIHYM